MDEYCYKCKADISVIRDGVVVGKHKCGNKFSSTIETDICPKCGQGELVLIPKAFLVLWDTDENVRAYVTEDMEVRSGLDAEGTHIARQIILKYGGIHEVPEYCI
ncbi:MAG: hypothetical protein GWN13_13035 [Phycisphaerae bacterium]|nr:hypothetical protein [Phycisphaerae bacterium]